MTTQNYDRQVAEAAALKKALGNYAEAILADTRQGLFAVDPEDFYVGRKLLHQGGCSEDELLRLQNLYNDRSKVLIVGSHIGILAIPIAKRCKELVVFEASPRNYRLLKMNLMLNNVHNCRAFNLAASNRVEKLEFLLSRVNSGGSKRTPIHKEHMYYYDSPQAVEVNAVAIDGYVFDRDFDLIIMDIEGSEYFALQGMPEILAGAKALQIEFIPHHLKNVAGVTVDDFLDQIEPHFTALAIFSKGLVLPREKFRPVLNEMFDRGQGDEGLVFLKADPNALQLSAAQ
jgi:FkbM family methyltransferase